MPKTILCVDDDPFYKDLFRAMLEPRGFKVVNAMNPVEGWAALIAAKPDLVTLDIMMPEAEGYIDGYGLLKKMRNEPGFASLPVIMISALEDSEDIKHALAAGATSYLPKHGMTPDSLVEEIRKLLG